MVERRRMKSHQLTSCIYTVVHCPGRYFHCQWTGPRFKLEDHTKSCSLLAAQPVLNSLIQQASKTQFDVDTAVTEVEKVSVSNHAAISQIREMMKEMESLKLEMTTLKKEVAELKGEDPRA